MFANYVRSDFYISYKDLSRAVYIQNTFGYKLEMQYNFHCKDNYIKIIEKTYALNDELNIDSKDGSNYKKKVINNIFNEFNLKRVNNIDIANKRTIIRKDCVKLVCSIIQQYENIKSKYTIEHYKDEFERDLVSKIVKELEEILKHKKDLYCDMLRLIYSNYDLFTGPKNIDGVISDLKIKL